MVAFSVRARVDLQFKDELSLKVSFLGIKLFILPKKPKKYKFSNYTLKKIAKRDKKKAEKEAKKAEKKKLKQDAKKKKKAEKKKPSKEEKKAKKASRPAISDMADLFLRLIKLFFSKFFGKFHFHVARIKIKVGSDNAATTALLYTAICGAFKPLLIILDKHSNLHGMKNADIDISPDFLHEKIEFDVDLGFSMSLGALLGVLIRVLFSALVGWGKIQPTPQVKEQSVPPTPKKEEK